MTVTTEFSTAMGFTRTLSPQNFFKSSFAKGVLFLYFPSALSNAAVITFASRFSTGMSSSITSPPRSMLQLSRSPSFQSTRPGKSMFDGSGQQGIGYFAILAA